MVPEDLGPDSGWAAEEWEEVEAGRDQAREVVVRERGARAEAVVRVRAEVCGKAERAEDRVAARVQVAALAQAGDRALAEAEPAALGREAEDPARVEVGERVAVRAEVARAELAEERARVRAEAEQAQVLAERAPVEADSVGVEQVLVPVAAEDLAPEVVRVEEAAPAREEELGEAGLDRAERERRENG